MLIIALKQRQKESLIEVRKLLVSICPIFGKSCFHCNVCIHLDTAVLQRRPRSCLKQDVSFLITMSNNHQPPHPLPNKVCVCISVYMHACCLCAGQNWSFFVNAFISMHIFCLLYLPTGAAIICQHGITYSLLVLHHDIPSSLELSQACSGLKML